MTICGRCSFKYGGTRTEHCMGCHETFTGTTSGDMHRTGHHGVTEGPNRRRCLTVEEMVERGMTRNGHGVWTTGQEMPAGRLSALGEKARNVPD